MQVKAQNPINFLNEKSTSPFIEVYFAINHLKNLYRQGWLKKGIPTQKCESVADHIFGVTVLVMIFADIFYPELDIGKLLKMSIIHDLGEIFAGDITPEDKISSVEKYNLEKASITRLFKGTQVGNEYLRLWTEYENGKSLEAQLIQQIDKLEMVYQAVIYGLDESKKLDDFYTSFRDNSLFPELTHIFNILEGYHR